MDCTSLQVWVPSLFLELLVFAFVLLEATIGLGANHLPDNRVRVIVAGLAGSLLLLTIDCLTRCASRSGP